MMNTLSGPGRTTDQIPFRSGERGSVLLLAVLGLTMLLGMVGLALDVGQMYAAKQQTQAIADAVVQAGVMDLYNGTNIGGNAFGGASLTCPSGIAPCQYAQLNGYNAAFDTVTIDFCSSGGTCGGTCSRGAASLSAADPVNVICATVSRVVNTTFLQVVGAGPSTVTARAAAGIISATAPTPLIVSHPTLSNALSVAGSSSISITGGIQRSFQLNSTSATAFSGGTVDLSSAGIAGSGADFAVAGGPAATPAGIQLGTAGHYVSHASAIRDPLASVSPPASPGFNGTRVALANGTNGCPVSPPQPCAAYSPGVYPTGINSTNEVSVFRPGIYYITGGGFVGGPHGSMLMALGCTDGASNTCTGGSPPPTTSGTNTGWINNLLFYFAGGGTVSFGATFGTDCSPLGSIACALVGAPFALPYAGILFSQDHVAAAGIFADFSGAVNPTLTGIIYATNTLATMTATPSQYQTVSFGGAANSSTSILGQIFADALTVANNSTVTVTLIPQSLPGVRQVALLQ